MKLQGTVLAVPLLVGVLAACTPAGTQIAEGGIGGTGISAGSLTAFGSMFVNGVEFDVSAAVFRRDGQQVAGQSDYSIGEYLTVVGDVDANGFTGVAAEIIFDELVEGSVTAASTDGATLEVLGQVVRTDALTVFIGFSRLEELSVGNMVEVSGLVDAAGQFIAGAIRRVATAFDPGSSENELKGMVSDLDPVAQRFQLGGLSVDFAGAALEDFEGAALQNGQLVEVESGQALVAGVLTADRVRLAREPFEFEEGTEVEIEGLVTLFISATDFHVNGLRVLGNVQTEFEGGQAGDLAENVRVEVEGTIDANADLVAEQVKILLSGNSVELEAEISAIDSQARRFTVLGAVVGVDSSTLFRDESSAALDPFRFADLRVGDQLEIKGNLQLDDSVLATRVKRKDRENDDEIELEGTVTASDALAGTLVVLGVTVSADGATTFIDADEDPVSQAAFFAALVDGVTRVKVEGEGTGADTATAIRLEIHD